MKYSQEEYFSCYSPNLKEYLIDNGFEVYTTFIHIRENKICWVFKRVPEMSIYLEQWSKNRRKINSWFYKEIVMDKRGLSKRAILCVLLALFVIISIFYYGRCYIINHELVFTESDKFILLIFSIISVFTSTMLILIILLLNKIKNNIINIIEELSDVEDNNIEMEKIIQKMIIELSKDLGVDYYSKKS